MVPSPEDRKLLIPENWWEILPRAVYAELDKIQCSEEWFEVYQVIKGVYVFYEPGQFEEAISTLIVGENKAVLIDTGCGIGNLKKAVEEITNLPVLVVNTHTHNDHVAQNYLFNEIAMFDHPRSHEVSKLGLPHHKMASLLAPGMVWKPLPKEFSPDKHITPPFKVTQWLKDGDTIDLGDRVLEIIHTPGHSPDSICLLERNTKLLFTGDMFYTGGIYTYLPGGDIPTFIQSYRKLMKFYSYFDRLMPSHNEPWVEKKLLKNVLQAVEDIQAGKGKYIEGTDRGVPIRKYVYDRFSIVTKVE